MAGELSLREVAALRAGYRRLGELAELLDAINVFPVADADTGANLKASFAPLAQDFPSAAALSEALVWSALGNSGNIGVGFLQGLLAEPSLSLTERCAHGAALARAAVAEPRQGTMLSVLERLVTATESTEVSSASFPSLTASLASSVAETTASLPVLAECGVIDAGALGIFAFLEAYLGTLVECPARTDVASTFAGRLRITGTPAEVHAHGRCIDAVLSVSAVDPELLAELRSLGESTVLVQSDQLIKLHLHADDAERVRRELTARGVLVRFDTSSLAPRPRASAAVLSGGARLVTDAAGSLPPALAEALGVEVLSSYVTLPDGARSEATMDRDAVFAALRAGQRVTTAQAPLVERHQRFADLLRRYERIVYVCVGSAFTGNHAVAREWARRQGVEDRFLVIDSGVASGRLAVLVDRLATRAREPGDLDYQAVTERLLPRSDELIFVDSLEYLARSGRVGRTSAWFGGLFGLKPVVTPTPKGAKRVAMVRSFEEQLDLATRRLGALPGGGAARILLQYTDNEALVRDAVLPRLRAVASAAVVDVVPLSLTTAVHTGPGTWALAMLPLDDDEEARSCA